MRGFVGTTLKVIGGIAVVLVALAVLLVIFVDPAEEEPQSGAPTTTAARKRAARLGEPVVMNGIAYTIIGVRRARNIGYGPAQGVYVVVDVKVENVSDEPADASLIGWTLVGGNGKRYSIRTTENAQVLSLQPDFSERSRLVYELMPAAARRARLDAEDCEYDLTSPELEATCVRRSFALGLR